MDASRPLAGELLLPAGRLREPVAAMSRANLDYFYSCRNGVWNARGDRKLDQYPVFAASTRLLGFRRFGGESAPLSANEIGAGPFFAFAVSAILTRSSAILGIGGLPFAAKQAFQIIIAIPSEIS